MSLKSILSALGDQVRRLSGKKNTMGLEEMTESLASVELGVNTEGLTAASSDVVSGKVFIGANSEQEIGTMVNRGAVDVTLDGVTKEYTVEAGYHNGKGKVHVETQTKTVVSSLEDKNVYPDSGKVISAVVVKPGVYTGTFTADSTYRILVDTGVQLSEEDQVFLFIDQKFDGLKDVALSRRLSPSDTVTYRVNDGFRIYGENQNELSGLEIVYRKMNGVFTSQISFQARGWATGSGYSSCFEIGDTYRWILIKR